MKHFYVLIPSIAFLFISSSMDGQVLNKSANWPNLDWIVQGSFNSNGLLSDPRYSESFSIETSSGFCDNNLVNISVESPTINLTNAFNAEEYFITLSGLGTIESFPFFVWEYWDQDTSNWVTISTINPQTVDWDPDYLTCANLLPFDYVFNISDFSSNQLINFKYRFFLETNCSLTRGLCIQNVSLDSRVVDELPVCDVRILSPVNEEIDVSINPKIKWDKASNGPSGYYISVGTTPNGTEIVDNLDLGNVTSYDANLSFSTKYYVNVTPYNSFGIPSDCQNEISFTTHSEDYIVFYGDNGEISWNNCDSSNEFSLEVNGVGNLDGTSKFLEKIVINKLEALAIGDLTISLISPDGTSILLSNKNGGSNDYYVNTQFTENASNVIGTAVQNIGFEGYWLPEGNLRDFYNINADGNWKLKICDDGTSSFNRRTQLNSWKIIFSSGQSCHYPLIYEVSNITSTSAEFTWSDYSLSSVGYDWRIMAYPTSPNSTSFQPVAEGNTSTSVTSASTLELLNDNRFYWLFVRSKCDNSTVSNWSVGYIFRGLYPSFEPPYFFDFTVEGVNFIGDGWYETYGDILEGPGINPDDISPYNDWFLNDNSFFLNDSNHPNGNCARINIRSNSSNNPPKDDWLISPPFQLNSSTPYYLNLDVAMFDRDNALVANMGIDDSIQVLISIDNGENWTNLYSWDSNNIPSVNGEAMPEIDLTSYAGNEVIIGFYGTNGDITDEDEDFYFFIDNFNITTSTLSIKDLELNSNFYPIPASDFLFIDLDQKANCVIYDVIGRVRLDLKLNIGTNKIVLEDNEPGVYFISLTNNNNNKIIKKIIKQ